MPNGSRPTWYVACAMERRFARRLDMSHKPHAHYTITCGFQMRTGEGNNSPPSILWYNFVYERTRIRIETPPTMPTNMHVDPISLEVFRHRCAAIAEEMGKALGRTAFSANIKERRDYSCAIFDANGHMIAQAAHIPVHLGAMPRSVEAALAYHHFDVGDIMVLNDPYLGGSHLPDITMVAPIFVADINESSPVLLGYVASRAHHADIGGMSPGSMPMSHDLYQEGLIIPPVLLQQQGTPNHHVERLICRNSRTPDERKGDLAAQRACHTLGQQRFRELYQVRMYTYTIIKPATATSGTTCVNACPPVEYDGLSHTDLPAR